MSGTLRFPPKPNAFTPARGCFRPEEVRLVTAAGTGSAVSCGRLAWPPLPVMVSEEGAPPSRCRPGNEIDKIKND